MSKCAYDYVTVLENPFSGKTACLPMVFNTPTMQHSFRAAGTFVTGTAGVGFIMVRPFRTGWTGYSNANGAIYFSAGTYTGTIFDAVSTDPGVGIASTNSPYARSLDATQATGRLVACGIRVRNVTALLNRGGILAGLETPDHISVGGMDLPGIMLYDTADSVNHTGGSWNSIVYHVVHSDDLDWYQADGTSSNFSLGFIHSGSAATPNTFEWEVYGVWEFQGSSVHGLKPNVSDAEGMSIAQNLTRTVAQRKPRSGDRGVWVQTLLNGAANLAVKGATMAFNRYMGGAEAFASISPSAFGIANGPVIEEIV